MADPRKYALTRGATTTATQGLASHRVHLSLFEENSDREEGQGVIEMRWLAQGEKLGRQWRLYTRKSRTTCLYLLLLPIAGDVGRRAMPKFPAR